MDTTLSHLSDQDLLSGLLALVARDRENMAALLAHLAEVDFRRLYLSAAYPSMVVYCIEELHLSEDEAYKRIRVARTARRYPVVLAALAEGRLHVSGVLELRGYLTEENVDALVVAASHKSRSEIQVLLAEKFPQLPLASQITPLESEIIQLAPGPVELFLASGGAEPELGPDRVELTSEGCGQRATTASTKARVRPLSPESFSVETTIDRETHEMLEYAQALLGHTFAPNDLPKLLARAMKALVTELEKKKFGANSRPRKGGGAFSRPGSRYIRRPVRMAVWKRDGGRCTFVSPETGRRCKANQALEFDHKKEFARGGEATVEGLRLLCRAHNQFAAEQTYGVGFMKVKRESAKQIAKQKREQAKRAAAEKKRAQAAAAAPPPPDPALDVRPWLRKLGMRPDEANRLAALCDAMPATATLEERIRFALSNSVRARCPAPP